jgi:hypothetical protein
MRSLLAAFAAKVRCTVTVARSPRIEASPHKEPPPRTPVDSQDGTANDSTSGQ